MPLSSVLTEGRLLAFVDDMPKVTLALALGCLVLLGFWATIDRRSSSAARIRLLYRARCRVLLAVLFLGVFGVVAEDVLFDEQDELVLQIDRRVYVVSAELAPSLHNVAWIISRLTGEGLAVVVAVGFAGLLIVRRPELASSVLLGTLSAWLVSGLLKVACGVLRPRADGSVNLLASYGFPSGHALVTLVACGLIAWAVGQISTSRALRVSLFGVAAVPAALGGAARVLLNAHWASDVIAGLALGATWLILAIAVAEPFVTGGSTSARARVPAGTVEPAPCASTRRRRSYASFGRRSGLRRAAYSPE